MSDKIIFKDKWFWASIFCGGFFLALTLWYSFGMDQAICAYMAWVWKDQHLAPYLGSWDLTYPGIFVIYRLAMTLFGESILGFRIFDLIAQLLSLAMIYSLAKKLSGSQPAGFLSCLFYGIYYFGLGRWSAGNREVYVLWLFIASLLVSFSWQGLRRAVAAGLLIGFAPLIKPPYGLAWLVLGIVFLTEGLRQKRKIPWRELAIYSVCCFLPAAIFILYYLELGRLNDLYRALIWYNFQIYLKLAALATGGDPYLKFSSLVKLFLLEQPLLLFSAIFFLSFKAAERRAWDQGFKLFLAIVSLCLVSLIALVIQAKYFSYHLIPFWGLIAILSGPAFYRIGSRLKSPEPNLRNRLVSGFFYAAVILLMTLNIKPEQLSFAAKYCFRAVEPAYYSRYESASDYALVSNYYLPAQYLKPLLKPRDQIEVFGVQPLLPFLLKKKIPSRFQNIQHLVYTPPGQTISDTQKQWIAEYTQAVIMARPRFFIVTDQQIPLSVDLSQPTVQTALSEQFPELNRFLRENYSPLRKFGLTEIYRLQ